MLAASSCWQWFFSFFCGIFLWLFILLLSACHVSSPIFICTKPVFPQPSSLLQLSPAESGCCSEVWVARCGVWCVWCEVDVWSVWCVEWSVKYEREDENPSIHNVHPVFYPLELKSVSWTMKKQGCAMCILVPTSEFSLLASSFCPSFDSAILSSHIRCNNWRSHLW